MDSSEDDDIIEIEPSTESENNLNSENQSEAESVNNSLNLTNDRVENETIESEQETRKGQEKANKVAEGRSESSSEPKEKAGRKLAQIKIPKAEKIHRKLVVKQKILRKGLIMNQRYQKWLQDPAAD